MKKALESQIDAIADQSAPAISDFQASDFLNQAIILILKKVMMQGMEANEYNRQFVAPLKKAASGSVTSDQIGVHTNGQFWELPEDFYQMLHERVIVDKRDCFTGELIEGEVIPVGEDYVSINKKNFEKKPYCTTAGNAAAVWRISFGTNDIKISELITDGTFGISQYNFRYLSRPIEVVIDLENPENQVDTNIYEEFHDDIINKAASIAIENMRLVSRFQTKEYLNKEQNL